MAPRLEWQRGPISGRLILYADGVLWPRAEMTIVDGEYVLVLFTTVEGANTVVGRFASLAEARVAAEQALVRATSEEPSARHSA